MLGANLGLLLYGEVSVMDIVNFPFLDGDVPRSTSSSEVLNKLKSRGFRATSLSTYDFSTLYTTLPHNLIKEKLIFN